MLVSCVAGVDAFCWDDKFMHLTLTCIVEKHPNLQKDQRTKLLVLPYLCMIASCLKSGLLVLI